MKRRRTKQRLRLAEKELAETVEKCILSWQEATEDPKNRLRLYLSSYTTEVLAWHLQLDSSWSNDRWLDSIEELTLSVEDTSGLKANGVLWWGLRSNIAGAQTSEPFFDIVAADPLGKRTVSIQVKTMSLHNKQGWRLSKDICSKRGNPNLFVVLVNLKADGNDYYIYEYDVLSERVSETYAKYMSIPKRDGVQRKDVDFRWFDFKYFTDDDYRRLNEWDILGFDVPPAI